MTAQLEHANLTVADPDATAAWMQSTFGWHIRWQGATESGLRAIHVGTGASYIALFAPEGQGTPATGRYATIGAMNHLGVVVDDLDATEAAVRAAGFTPHHHADYAPGRRFYFMDDLGVEYEVVSYTA
ncbi:MAG: catechol 2,3-dioxygenase-like lactoylglutathione lyase family enzyme [Sulfitobacter sp.]|jgi:catechol 2,3-dioxygenase-like lactoylglutathione lyase family enzyme